jgi:hypothetical protein
VLHCYSTHVKSTSALVHLGALAEAHPTPMYDIKTGLGVSAGSCGVRTAPSQPMKCERVRRFVRAAGVLRAADDAGVRVAVWRRQWGQGEPSTHLPLLHLHCSHLAGRVMGGPVMLCSSASGTVRTSAASGRRSPRRLRCTWMHPGAEEERENERVGVMCVHVLPTVSTRMQQASRTLGELCAQLRW